MADLKNKIIGGKSVTLKKVPASNARKIQTLLIASASKPLAEALSQKADKSNNIKAMLGGISGIIENLKDGELDELIQLCQPFILIDGETFNEDKHFDANTLFDMYEVLWFFLRETFEVFIQDALSRFPKANAIATALNQ